MTETLPIDDWRDPSRVAFAGTLAVVLAAPFERLAPLVRLPGQQISDVEMIMLLALVAWVAASVVRKRRPNVSTPITWPAAGLLITLFIAATLAPVHAVNALKATLRLTAGFAVFLMTVDGVASFGRVAAVAIAALAGAAVVSVAAIGEYLGDPHVLAWLQQFRDGLRVVGGEVRATGTLQYPTITSMYLEIVFALTLGLVVALALRRRWFACASAIVAAVLLIEGITLTLTRAGLISALVSLALIGGSHALRHGRDRGLAAVALTAALAMAVVAATWPSQSFMLRFTSENRRDWYRVAFQAPGTLTLAAGDIAPVDVAVTNTGRINWQGGSDAPFYASYHWLDATGRRVIDYDGVRTPFPRVLAPGDSLALTMLVRAPGRAGTYRIAWDVVQEHRLWFSTEAGAVLTESAAAIVGASASVPIHHRGPYTLPTPKPIVGRGLLWRAALRIAAARPLLGIGLDNFRLTYGNYIGLVDADPRVHSNEMYLELLASGGILAAALLLWCVWRAGRAAIFIARRLNDADAALYSGIAAASVAVLIHGLVDSFLTFTPTYLLMAVTFGLAMAPAREVARAHRV